MKKKIKYTDEDLGELRIIEDFLPRPEDLILREKTVKITLSLTEKTIAFFKEQAEIHHTQYQKMIRVLLDEYVAHLKARTPKQKRARHS